MLLSHLYKKHTVIQEYLESEKKAAENYQKYPHPPSLDFNSFFFFLINCWNSVVASVVLPQFVQSPL